MTLTDRDRDMRDSAIVAGIRKEYPQYTPDKYPDEDILPQVYKNFYSDYNPDDFHDAMQERFAPTWKPTPPAPAPSLASVGKTFVKDTAREVVEDAMGAGRAMGKAAAVITGNVPQELPEMSLGDLSARGYPPEVAKNVMQQRIGTQQDIANEQQQIGQQGQEQAARGIAFAASIPAGGAATEAMGAAAGPLSKAAAGGAGGTAAYMGLKAAAEGKSASEILDELNKGAALGFIAGPLFHSILAPIGKGIAVVAKYPEKMKGLANAKRLESVALNTMEFAKRFQPQWLQTRFADTIDPSLPPDMMANVLLNKLMGQEAAQVAPPEALEMLTKKISQYQDFGRIDPSVRSGVALGPGMGQEAGLQAVGLPTDAPLGGLAPTQAFEPQSIAGPMGEQAPQFAPPVAVLQMPGVQGPTTGAVPAPPVVPQGPMVPPATPEMMNPPSVPTPLTGSVQVPQAPAEPRPVDLGPTTVEPRVLPNEMDLRRALAQPSGEPGPVQEPRSPLEKAEPAPAEKKGLKVVKVSDRTVRARKITVAKDLVDLDDKEFKKKWGRTKDEARKLLDKEAA